MLKNAFSRPWGEKNIQAHTALLDYIAHAYPQAHYAVIIRNARHCINANVPDEVKYGLTVELMIVLASLIEMHPRYQKFARYIKMFSETYASVPMHESAIEYYTILYRCVLKIYKARERLIQFEVSPGIFVPYFAQKLLRYYTKRHREYLPDVIQFWWDPIAFQDRLTELENDGVDVSSVVGKEHMDAIHSLDGNLLPLL